MGGYVVTDVLVKMVIAIWKDGVWTMGATKKVGPPTSAIFWQLTAFPFDPPISAILSQLVTASGIPFPSLISSKP